MAAQTEKIGHAGLVGGGETSLHSHAGGGGLPTTLAGLLPGLRGGATRYYPAGAGYGSTALTTGAATANVLRAYPFMPPRDVTADRLAVMVTTLLAGKIRLGLYTDGGALYPASLLVESGELDTGATGLKQTAVNQALTRGVLYWVVYCANAAATYRALAVGSQIPILGLDNTLGTASGIGWTVAYTYAALPGSYPGGATVITSATQPALFLRIA